jgi:NDP-sugar pyrophosphorylase family protein
MENWVSQGITDFIFLLHYEAPKIIEFIKQWHALKENRNFTVEFITEEKPLGTGGSIANAVQCLKLSSSFFVTNADTWLDSGFMSLRKSPFPSIAITKVKNASRYGTVITGPDNYVEKFAEKVPDETPGWINAGISHLDPKIFLSWKGQICSLEADYFPKLAMQRNLSSVRLYKNFIDIGIPEDYDRFCKWVQKGQTTIL